MRVSGELVVLIVVFVIGLATLNSAVANSNDERSRFEVCPEINRELDPFAPTAGCSLFDRLFVSHTDTASTQVPFPFVTLLRRLQSFLPADDGSEFTTLKTVLIPKGRSLRRDVAAPEFFRYPRVLAVFDTRSRYPVLMRDRLFVGYQERANAVEVISYNETLGRFEFQVVHDYRPGGSPRLRYANRNVCTSCHQNGAAIFPLPNWSETNFIRDVAAQIGRYHETFHGVVVDARYARAGFIDGSAARANLFASYQKLWRLGCSNDTDRQRERRCRAGAFLTMVKKAMSGFPLIDKQSRWYRQDLKPLWVQNWDRFWPQGLRVPDSNIANRVVALSASPAIVHNHEDPLNPRPPTHLWTLRQDADRVLTSMADEFFLRPDLRALDSALKSTVGSLTELWQGECRMARDVVVSQRQMLSVDCALRSPSADDTLVVIAEIERARSGEMSPNWIKFGFGMALTELRWSNARFHSVGAMRGLELHFGSRSSARTRLSDGAGLNTFRLEWRSDTDQAHSHDATATLSMRRDFHLVENALESILADPVGREIFADRPFDSGRMIAAVRARLNSNAANNHQSGTAISAAARPPAAGRGGNNDPLSDDLLARFCGSCHGYDTERPPGFLYGDANRIEKNVTQCAPRMRYRVHMWREDANARDKAPMPPPVAVAALGYTQNEWVGSEELQALQDYLATLVQSDNLPLDYARLPPCEITISGER